MDSLWLTGSHRAGMNRPEFFQGKRALVRKIFWPRAFGRGAIQKMAAVMQKDISVKTPRLLLMVVLGSFSLAASSNAGPGSSSEYAVKAALLINFSRFTQWPEIVATNGNFNICIIGKNPFGDTLNYIVGKRLHGDTVTVNDVSNDDLRNCHIAFFSGRTSNRISKPDYNAGKLPVLTISDVDGFSDNGGIIELKVINNKVRFYINTDVATESGIVISSKLLRLASKIKSSRAGGT